MKYRLCLRALSGENDESVVVNRLFNAKRKKGEWERIDCKAFRIRKLF